MSHTYIHSQKSITCAHLINKGCTLLKQVKFTRTLVHCAHSTYHMAPRRIQYGQSEIITHQLKSEIDRAILHRTVLYQIVILHCSEMLHCNTAFEVLYLQYYIFKTVYAIMHLQWCKAKLYCTELFCDEIPFPYCQCFVLSSHHWQWIKWQLILLMHSSDPSWPSQTSDRISCFSHLIELIEDVRMMETVSWWLMMMMMALPTLLPYERWKEAQPADISDRSKNFVCRIYLSLYSYLYLSLFFKAYLSLYSYSY